MYLPGIESACITEAKLSGYLLSLEHPSGYAVSSVQSTAFGTKYLVDGDIRGPAGDAASIRSVWFVEAGDMRPRLVTAYPLRGRPQ